MLILITGLIQSAADEHEFDLMIPSSSLKMPEEIRRHTIAISGEIIPSTNESSPICSYLVSLAFASRAQRSNKVHETLQVCMIPQACLQKERLDSLVHYTKEFQKLSADVSCLFLNDCTDKNEIEKDLLENEIEKDLLEQDLIFIDDGDICTLSTMMQKRSIDTILKRAHRTGIVIVGSGAGAAYLFEEAITETEGRYSREKGLGLISGSCDVSSDRTIKTAYRPVCMMDPYTAIHSLTDDYTQEHHYLTWKSPEEVADEKTVKQKHIYHYTRDNKMLTFNTINID
jgi:hypothetical protein